MVAPDGKGENERTKRREKKQDGGAIFIRDTFYEQNGRGHVRTDIVEIMAQIYRVPINPKIYPTHEKNYNFAVDPKLPD